MKTLLSLIIIVSGLIVTFVIAQMETEQAGLGTLQGASDTSLWGQHKGSSKKDIQNRIVIVSSIVFALALLVLAAFS
ncbi:preprotein translocase subunit SecG [Peptoniphilus raoultii]|uniref:preprotein translocase subunit SecG n=1 Tax=Peptoniphilus raoultii TaxID=1776387 RepID=UPI0008D92ED9|nr:preprotein translocase subunit SecG [Peptoniphilus raoultii]